MGVLFGTLGVFGDFLGLLWGFGNFYLQSVHWMLPAPPAAVGLWNFGAGTPRDTPERGPGGNSGNSGAALGDVGQDLEFWEFPAPQDHPWEPPGAGRGRNGDSGSCKENPVR